MNTGGCPLDKGVLRRGRWAAEVANTHPPTAPPGGALGTGRRVWSAGSGLPVPSAHLFPRDTVSASQSWASGIVGGQYAERSALDGVSRLFTHRVPREQCEGVCYQPKGGALQWHTSVAYRVFLMKSG